eukprot:3423751-Pyramimonas_sp.AAC.1
MAVGPMDFLPSVGGSLSEVAPPPLSGCDSPPSRGPRERAAATPPCPGRAAGAGPWRGPSRGPSP